MEKYRLAKDLSESIKYMMMKPHPYPADKRLRWNRDNNISF